MIRNRTFGRWFKRRHATKHVRRTDRRLRLDPLEERVLLSVSPIDDFAGRAFVDDSPERVVPPDTHLAVGPHQVVETVNRHVAFYNKESGVEIFSETLDLFFAEAGADESDPANGVGVGVDPKVVYDEAAERFVIVALERNLPAQTSHLLIAVSDDANPMGNWEKHRIDAEDADTYWADYTALGWDADAYYVSVNMFEWGSSYDHHSIFTFDKSTLIDGDESTLAYFDVDRSSHHFTMWPALMHGAQPGDPMYFVEGSPSGAGAGIRVVQMTDKLSADPTFNDFSVHVPNYSWVVNPTQPDGGKFHITNIGTRILSAAWRNDRLVTGHHVGLDGVARARWYEIDTGSARPKLIQSGEIDAGPSIHTYMPSLDIAPNGDIGMTYLQSSTDSGDVNGDGFKDGYLSMYITGRKADDPLGTMQPQVLVKAGEASYIVEDQIPDVVVDPPPYRVGDFSGTVVDPVDGTFWVANEYATAPLPPSFPFTANWGTWIAQFEITSEGQMERLAAAAGSVPEPLVVSPAVPPAENSFGQRATSDTDPHYFAWAPDPLLLGLPTEAKVRPTRIFQPSPALLEDGGPSIQTVDQTLADFDAIDELLLNALPSGLV